MAIFFRAYIDFAHKVYYIKYVSNKQVTQQDLL